MGEAPELLTWCCLPEHSNWMTLSSTHSPNDSMRTWVRWLWSGEWRVTVQQKTILLGLIQNGKINYVLSANLQIQTLINTPLKYNKWSSVMMHIFNPSTLETNGLLWVWGYPSLQRKMPGIHGYSTCKPSLKDKTKLVSRIGPKTRRRRAHEKAQETDLDR